MYSTADVQSRVSGLTSATAAPTLSPTTNTIFDSVSLLSSALVIGKQNKHDETAGFFDAIHSREHSVDGASCLVSSCSSAAV